MHKATILTTLAETISAEDSLTALPREIAWLEVRADLIGDPSIDQLRKFNGKLLYTLRSRKERGADLSSPAARGERLLAAANHYDLIALEADRDLTPELLAAVPPERRLITWHGSAADLTDLEARFAACTQVPARFYRVVPTATRPGEALLPLLLLKSLNRSDVISFSYGAVGFWSRLVAPSFGSPFISTALDGSSELTGEPSVTRLMRDYGLPDLHPFDEIYGIAGNPVSHSLSPRLHNAAYRAFGKPALFVPFHVESLGEFWSEVVESSALASLGLSIAGMTVASPNKEAALLKATVSSSITRQADSANILVRENEHWRADTTDPDVVFAASRERGVQVQRKRAAVIGCGGAGRAIAAGLSLSGANVTLVNRSPERGERASQLLGFPYQPLKGFDVCGYEIVVNATPVGRDDGQIPFTLENLDRNAVVIDLVYGSSPTPLVAGTDTNGRTVIDGRAVLLTQVLRQFEIMTGRTMPVALARQSLSGDPSSLTAASGHGG
jgi:3-dehydroquinate dehydratase / shikimate dehydrogenase